MAPVFVLMYWCEIQLADIVPIIALWKCDHWSRNHRLENNKINVWYLLQCNIIYSIILQNSSPTPIHSEVYLWIHDYLYSPPWVHDMNRIRHLGYSFIAAHFFIIIMLQFWQQCDITQINFSPNRAIAVTWLSHVTHKHLWLKHLWHKYLA